MYDINSCIISGRLTRDPEMKSTQSGKIVARFSIANNCGKDKDAVSFFDCAAFDKTADIIGKHCTKGSHVAIECKVDQRRYTDKAGQNVSRVGLIVNRLHFMGAKDRPAEKSGTGIEFGDDVGDHEVPF